MLECCKPLVAPDDDAGVPIGAPDAPDRDIRRVTYEVCTLVAALQGGPVKVPDRLLYKHLSVEVLYDQLPADDVHPADVVQVNAALVPDLLQHQLLVVEALRAEKRDGQGDSLHPRRPPGPRARLHGLYPLDLTRRPDN